MFVRGVSGSSSPFACGPLCSRFVLLSSTVLLWSVRPNMLTVLVYTVRGVAGSSSPFACGPLCSRFVLLSNTVLLWSVRPNMLTVLVYVADVQRMGLGTERASNLVRVARTRRRHSQS